MVKKNDNLPKIKTTTKKVWFFFFFVTLNFIQKIYLDKINRNISHYKEIVVCESFQVENGVLGLERDVYLSIVKFLDSPIVRKVWVSTSV
jgi:hypothetical protein